MADKEYYLPGEQPPAVNRGTSTAPLPAVDWTTWSAQPEWKRNLVAALDAAPAVGGMGGDIAAGVLGTPLEALNAVFPGLGVLTHAGFTVAGGGTGGALGQGIREGGYRALGLGDAPGTIGGASREQATMGALGQMAGPVVTGLARGAYESMLRPTVRQLRENPAVAKLAWDLNGVIPKVGEKSRLQGLVKASKAEADNLVAKGGKPITVVTMPPPPGPTPRTQFIPQQTVTQPAIGDLAQYSRREGDFKAAVDMAARKFGVDRQTVWELANKPALDTQDYATAFNRYGMNAQDLDGLRALHPGQAPTPTVSTVIVPTQPPAPVRGVPTVSTVTPSISWQQIDAVEQKLLNKYAKDTTNRRANSVREFFNDLREKWNPNNDTSLTISLEDAMALKRSADEDASPVYRARLARTSPNAVKPDEYYGAAKAVADELRSTLNKRVPGLKPVNARTSQLQAAANVLEESSLPRKFNLFAMGHGTNPLAAAVGGGTGYVAAHGFGMDPYWAAGLGGGATMAASHMLEASKPAISQAYLFLGKNPFAQNAIRQLPRAVDGLLQYPMNQNTAPAWYGTFPSETESPSATPRRPGDFYLPGELNP